ncbi:hypothetical protein [Pelotomaculum sp. FP]|uniref:hypothetical protein n=1 Tax=Pelotomaculum sp. FP TaxID=261474 RepID=UPI00186505EB|nr:hypothetical protein [Pelotomaculum sp. FP]
MNTREAITVLKLIGGGVTPTSLACPKCRGKSVQSFPAKTLIYHRCQYCGHKWAGVKAVSRDGMTTKRDGVL